MYVSISKYDSHNELLDNDIAYNTHKAVYASDLHCGVMYENPSLPRPAGSASKDFHTLRPMHIRRINS